MPERSLLSLQFNEVQAQMPAVASVSPIRVLVKPGVSSNVISGCIGKRVRLDLVISLLVSGLVSEFPSRGLFYMNEGYCLLRTFGIWDTGTRDSRDKVAFT